MDAESGADQEISGGVLAALRDNYGEGREAEGADHGLGFLDLVDPAVSGHGAGVVQPLGDGHMLGVLVYVVVRPGQCPTVHIPQQEYVALPCTPGQLVLQVTEHI